MPINQLQSIAKPMPIIPLIPIRNIIRIIIIQHIQMPLNKFSLLLWNSTQNNLRDLLKTQPKLFSSLKSNHSLIKSFLTSLNLFIKNPSINLLSIGHNLGTQPTKINPKSHNFTTTKNWAPQIYQ